MKAIELVINSHIEVHEQKGTLVNATKCLMQFSKGNKKGGGASNLFCQDQYYPDSKTSQGYLKKKLQINILMTTDLKTLQRNSYKPNLERFKKNI